MILQKSYSVGIYVRLSKDDERNGESVSIENQKLLLTKYVAEQPSWSLHEVYVDDGWSGTNFQRPAFQKMLGDAKEGVINLIIVKDLSRFGRNYIEVGQFTDYVFPAIGCRFIALNNNVDTIRNDNDMLPFLSVLNEFHSRDTSKKVRAVKKVRAEAGKFMGTYAPYGFKKDPDDKHRLVIDERTAPVIRRIFTMRCEGMGYYSIACALNDDKILSPREAYYNELGQENPTYGNGFWSSASIMNLMRNEVYIGHMVQCKTGTISFKNRKQVDKPEDEWIRVDNTHEPIIGQEVWDRAHEINAKRHRPKKTATGESNMFVGLLKCADCGYPMRFQMHRDKRKDGGYNMKPTFLCGNYSRSGKNACTAHVIQESALTDVVLADIQGKAEMVSMNEPYIIQEVTRLKNTTRSSQLVSFKQELKNLTARIAELEKIIQNLYEDRVKGAIPETVFASLIEKYEQERLTKNGVIETLRGKIAGIEKDWDDAARWTDLMKKHMNIETLDVSTLFELIDRIEVGAAQGTRKNRIHDISIYYRFLENVNLNELEVRYEYAI